MSDSGAETSRLPGSGAGAALDSPAAGPGLPAGRILATYRQMLIWLFIGTLVVVSGMLAMILPFYLSYLYGNGSVKEPSIFLIAALCGALGAFCSALIRLYNFTDLPKAIMSDQLRGLNDIHLFVYSLVPAAIGAIAAAALYLIFAAGILQGALFPHFTCQVKGDDTCGTLTLFMKSWGPNAAQDYAKVLVWGFVAGFAERFVPDTLQRLVQSGNSASDSL